MHILSFFLLGILPVIALATFQTPDPIFGKGYSKIYDGEREFSINMIKQIRENHPTGNLFFSPFSTYNALLLAYFGSSAATESELAQVLKLGWATSKDQVVSAYTISKVKDKMRSRQSPLTLSSVNRIFVDKLVQVNKTFEIILHNEIEKIDFKYQPENSLSLINDWIANKTYDQIRDMLSSDDISSETMFVLANAAYMKGDWLSQFKVENTIPKRFYINEYEHEQVPMMHQTATFKITYNERLQSQILKLPYRTLFQSAETRISTPEDKSDISMVIILPVSNEVNVNDVISRLDAKSLGNLIDMARPEKVDLAVPKFEFQQRLKLTPILAGMGLTNMFDSSATFKDLTPEHISIDDAQHFAKIKVDEMGSTAAAATVLFTSRSAKQPDPNKFICDHPFVFLIYDEKVKTILFAGVYSDPRKMKH
ncbi:serine protease inhibitor 88Ea [Drosophila eugracilis]|uniref:serine protease inhibitor 88Ea n=1 Tax=Drosophila eugracilis TaxID=29029 RepID=UPI0007E77F6D|nr:serine protease inhibitor 88Ea [Drosophila eugracilis]XP_017064845.1 serine protease inhibitor 88Ea [Drosophila eugracilis]